MADWPGILGALTGTVSLGWQVVAWFRDGHRFKVTCEIRDDPIEFSGGVSLPSESLFIEVVNHGTKTGYLRCIKGSGQDGKPRDVYVLDPPEGLAPGQLWSQLEDLRDGLPDDIVDLWAEDTVGGTFHVKKRLLQTALKRVRTARTQLPVVRWTRGSSSGLA
jgi:hypothetical protein